MLFNTEFPYGHTAATVQKMILTFIQ